MENTKAGDFSMAWHSYTPKSDYIQPEEWKRIVSVIKDYKRLKSEFENVVEKDGQYFVKHWNKKPSAVSKAKIEAMKKKIDAFETAFESVDEETKELVRQRFYKGKLYRDIDIPMSESTMKHYMRTFIVEVGKNLGEI